VQPLPVVEHVDVVKDRHMHFQASRKDATLNRSELERSKETLCHHIVVAVARPTHAADHFALTCLGIDLVGELAAPVRVQDYARRRAVVLQGHRQRLPG
jgi:hypothetical protein